MDDKKKQTLLIVILAVVGLGWGSYYFFIRDSGVVDESGVTTGQVERRVREDIAESKAKTTTRRAPKREAPKERVAPARREREAADTTSTAARRTRTGKEKTVKKKKSVPAA